MKNILLLSHIYPGDGVPKTYTPVVHYFAKEWQKMGFNVRVISIWTYFPFFYYWIPNWVRNYAIKKYQCALPEKQLSKRSDYILDDVKVTRITFMKLKPGSKGSERRLNKLANDIKDILFQEQFTPDYIISHWAIPQVYLSKCLKNIYHVPTALVLHENGHRIQEYSNWKELIDEIDVWGYRSEKIKEEFEKHFGKPKHSFRCNSGIPSCYLENIPSRDFSERNNFIYVGYLMNRKYPDVLINTVSELYQNKEYQLNIIGEGEMRGQLERMIMQKKIQDKVHLLGRLERTLIIPLLDQSDIFVMISKNEVFGLVYMEAMARGCIVIASKGEGMEGIIKNGINGFLCEAGNAENLKTVLQTIDKMPKEKLQIISQNAISTARRYTESSVAKNYIDNITTLLL